MNGSHHRSPRRTRRAGIRNFRPAVEQLEDRSLLSAFATIQGDISTPTEKDVLPIRIDAEEHDDFGWFTFGEAYERIRWTDDREALERLETRLSGCQVVGLSGEMT